MVTYRFIGLIVLSTSIVCSAQTSSGGTTQTTIDDQSEAVIQAVAQNDVKKVELLLADGADANAKDKAGWTPLISAAFRGYRDVLKTLIASGAKVNERAPDGRTALIAAAAERHPEIVHDLIAAGADVDAMDNDGNTALIRVAMGLSNVPDDISDEAIPVLSEKAKKVIGTLLEKHADVNKKNRKGESALGLAKIWAEIFGDPSVTQLLLKAGALE